MSSSASSHLSRPISPPGPQSPSKPKGPREGRSLIACQRCRRLKKKCKPEEGRARCERCRITDQTCSYVPVGSDDSSHEKKLPTSPSHSHHSPEPSPKPSMRVAVDDSIPYSFPLDVGSMGCHPLSFPEDDVYSIRRHGRLSYQQNETNSLGRLGEAHITNIYFPSNIMPTLGFRDASQMSYPSRPSFSACDR